MDWLTFVDVHVILQFFVIFLQIARAILTNKQQIVNMLTNYIAEFLIILIFSTRCFWLAFYLSLEA